MVKKQPILDELTLAEYHPRETLYPGSMKQPLRSSQRHSPVAPDYRNREP